MTGPSIHMGSMVDRAGAIRSEGNAARSFPGLVRAAASTVMLMSIPAGWKDDPEHPNQWRYWDGQQWTEDRAPKQIAPPPSSPQANQSTLPLWLLGAAALGVLGAFLPWAQAGPFSVNGTDGDGVITLILSVVLAVLGFKLRSRDDHQVSTGFKVACFILSAIITAVAIYDIIDVESNAADVFIETSAGIGLYLTAVAGVTGIVTAVRLKRKPKEPEADGGSDGLAHAEV